MEAWHRCWPRGTGFLERSQLNSDRLDSETLVALCDRLLARCEVSVERVATQIASYLTERVSSIGSCFALAPGTFREVCDYVFQLDAANMSDLPEEEQQSYRSAWAKYVEEQLREDSVADFGGDRLEKLRLQIDRMKSAASLGTIATTFELVDLQLSCVESILDEILGDKPYEWVSTRR